MYKFDNDYSMLAHPDILKELNNQEAYVGYGLDTICEEAKAAIYAAGVPASSDIHFVVGGTQANLLMLEAALRPIESVISADTGHIFVHEAGAIEHTGHKVEYVPSYDGKLKASDVRKLASEYYNGQMQEHITKPSGIYISQPTEYGTLYTKAELRELREVADEYGMFIYVDGARLGYALAASECDTSLADLSKLTDAYYIGGTKCGAMIGEAMIINNPVLKPNFRSFIKMNGALLAKGWLLGLQFKVLMQDNKYTSICAKAVKQAKTIQDAAKDANICEYIKSATNQLFFVFSESQMKELQKEFIFDVNMQVGENKYVLRFCTSWYTSDEDVSALCQAFQRLNS